MKVGRECTSRCIGQVHLNEWVGRTSDHRDPRCVLDRGHTDKDGRNPSLQKGLDIGRSIELLFDGLSKFRLVKLSDLVLHKVKTSDLTHARGKLAPNWEDPYRVTEVIQDETYQLNT
ncbi:hypothetical protein GW17_00053892 [Ensete ventricosum]|nr:hypothetical protein GW17_00053892 [Ensete ventricosum]